MSSTMPNVGERDDVSERDRPLILIVDDNSLNAKLSQGMLTAGGYRTAVARDGEQGLRLAEDLQPALVLTDLQMPGMDGLELTRRLKASPATARIPVVALTAHAMAQHREAALATGCCGYLAKPVRYQSLLVEVAAVLNRTSNGAQ